MKSKLLPAIFILICILLFTHNRIQGNETKSRKENYIWQIRSIDTMKSSRDKAKAELNNSSYDNQIKKELDAIKNTGANYVAIGTPYDQEFQPYMKRWIKLARQRGLHIWFRGNWSAWEGWFGYPKTMTPEEHLKSTYSFIVANRGLFEDGDIFDSCPECENSGHWVQPALNSEYNTFIRAQAKNNADAFKKIEKNVYTNLPSIIGGRAKEVLDKETINQLDDVVTIDHYVSDIKFMESYLDYFRDDFNAKVLVSEFGAPIPDINGPMNEDQQAVFINDMFRMLSTRRNDVVGINYYVSLTGTTPLLNNNYSPRKAYQVVKNYYSPGIITGFVKNTLGESMPDVLVQTIDNTITSKTDENGEYTLVVPAGTVGIKAVKAGFSRREELIKTDNGSIVYKHFEMAPLEPEPIYNIRLFLDKII